MWKSIWTDGILAYRSAWDEVSSEIKKQDPLAERELYPNRQTIPRLLWGVSSLRRVRQSAVSPLSRALNMCLLPDLRPNATFTPDFIVFEV